MRESVTFIHAADLHLDAPFQGLSAEDERVGRELAESTYSAWRRVVDTAIERSVDFVVVAGDVYNAADRSLRAQLRLREQALRLEDADIALLLVHGNHDPVSGWSAGVALPTNVHVFPAGSVERVEVVADGDFVCAVYGRSFQKAAERSDFTPGYRREAADTVSIGLLHANVGNNVEYDPYAPCTLDGLRAGGMDYWALGHIHKHEVLSQDPWVVYAGSPQGLNPKETGAHGCCVVEVTRSRAVRVEHVALAAIGWAAESLDVSGCEDVDDVRALVTAACGRVREDLAGPGVVRLELTGRSRAHRELGRPGLLGELLEDVRAEQAAIQSWLWVDRLADATGAAIDLDEVRGAPDFSADLVRVADELGADQAALEALVGELAGPLLTTLSGYEPQEPQALLERARDMALDLLLQEGGER